METKEYISRLLIGSRKVDQMRDEIHQVVTTLVGLVNGHTQRPDTGDPETVIKHFDSSDNGWELLAKIPKDRFSYILGVGYRIRSVSGSGSSRVYDFNPKRFYDLKHISTTHKALPDFVDGMFKLFPDIKEAAQPLIAASYEL